MDTVLLTGSAYGFGFISSCSHSLTIVTHFSVVLSLNVVLSIVNSSWCFDHIKKASLNHLWKSFSVQSTSVSLYAGQELQTLTEGHCFLEIPTALVVIQEFVAVARFHLLNGW